MIAKMRRTYRVPDRLHIRPGQLGVHVGRGHTHRRVADQGLDRHQSHGNESDGHGHIDIQRHFSLSVGRHAVRYNLHRRDPAVESK